MSLKKTKAFLEHYSKAMPPGYPGGVGGDNAREALAEIAKLERAAKVLDASKSGDDYSETDLRDAFTLMEAIAKEAK